MTTREIIDGLEMLCFFNQRAGRELWGDKPKQIQDEDIEHADKILCSAISALEELNNSNQEVKKSNDLTLANSLPTCNNLQQVATDTISRQAAIDAMRSACGNDCDKSEFVYDAPQDEQVILCPEHYALTSLPSAQPELVTNRHDLTAAIEAIERILDRCEEIEAHLPEGDPDRVGYKMYPDWLTVWKYLHQVPSAQPEIKTGRWIYNSPVTMRCDQCGYVVKDWEWSRANYCAGCGIPMRKGGEG